MIRQKVQANSKDTPPTPNGTRTDPLRKPRSEGDGTISRFPSPTWSGFSSAERCISLVHGDLLGVSDFMVTLVGPLSGLEPRSRHRRCEVHPMSTWSDPPRSLPAVPTLQAATRCTSVGPYYILEVRLSHETRGWSPRCRSWEGSSTGRFFEKSTRWREHSGKSTSDTGSCFVDTSRIVLMEGRLQRLEVQGLREQGSSSPRALSLPEERQNPMSAARSVADLVFLGHAGVG